MSEYYVVQIGEAPERVELAITCMAPISWPDGEIVLNGPCGSPNGRPIHAHGAHGAAEPARWWIHERARKTNCTLQALGSSPPDPFPPVPDGAESDPWAGVIEVYRLDPPPR